MALDNYSDNTGETTLAEDVDGSETVLTVANAAALPSPPFPLLLTADSLTAGEWVRVTGVASNDLTVVRGSYGTSATTHSNGAKVRHGVPMQRIRGIVPPFPPMVAGSVYTPYGAGQRGTDDPGASTLVLSWAPTPNILAAPDLGIEVTTAGVEGAGAEAHVLLYDDTFQLIADEIIDTTSTGLRANTLTGETLWPSWMLRGYLRLGAWTTPPVIRTVSHPYGGRANLEFDQTGEFSGWMKFGSVGSVPSSVDLSEFTSYRTAVPAVFIRPN